MDECQMVVFGTNVVCPRQHKMGVCLYHRPSVCPWVSEKYPMFLWGDDAFALKTIPYEALSPAWTRPGEKGLQLST